MSDVVVIGSYNRDLLFATDALPGPGQTRLGRYATAHGGKGFNQAVGACRLGAATLFVGAVGEDAYATEAREFARAEGLECRWQTVAGATGLACVLTDPEGRNQIVVAPGANEALGRAHVTALAGEIETARVLVAQLESSLDATAAGLQIAREARVTTILNPAPIRDDLPAELIGLADIITPNESEFAHLYQRVTRERLPRAWDAADGDRLHRWCRQTGFGSVVITLGERGCFVSHAEGSRFGSVESWQKIPATTVEAVDTTGAGDAFNGALAAGLVRFGGDFTRALELAVRAAGISVTRPGAAPSMPYYHELGLTAEK